MVTTAHQNPSGIDLKCDCGDPASAKQTVLEKRTTPRGMQKKRKKRKNKKRKRNQESSYNNVSQFVKLTIEAFFIVSTCTTIQLHKQKNSCVKQNKQFFAFFRDNANTIYEYNILLNVSCQYKKNIPKPFCILESKNLLHQSKQKRYKSIF